MIFNEIKYHVNTSLGLVGGCIPYIPPVSAPGIVWTLKQTENMHEHWFVSFRQQEHAFLGSALHFIQITWFTSVA